MAMVMIGAADTTMIGRLRQTLARLLRSRRRKIRPGPAIRLDERLLADVGLTERDVLGVEGLYWRDWEKSQRAWSL